MTQDQEHVEQAHTELLEVCLRESCDETGAPRFNSRVNSRLP